MAQLAVGLTHAMRGNARRRGDPAGARRGNIAGYADAPPHGIDVAWLVLWAREAAANPDLDVRPPLLRGPGSPPAAGGDSPG